MTLEAQNLMLYRDQISGIILGTIFLFVGLSACAMAVIHGRGGVRILVWFGVFSGIYGTRILAQQPAAFALLPQSCWGIRIYVIAILTYLILIPALLFWYELCTPRARRFVLILIVAASAIGAVGVCSVFVSDSPFRFMIYNRIVAIVMLLGLGVVNTVPKFARSYLIIQSRVSAIGTLILAVAALHSNLKDFFHLPAYPYLEPLAFAVFIFSLGYVAAEKIFIDERRLLAIDNELAIAREIQNSILPSGVPELAGLRIHAAYCPMTAVAGDFYEFIQVDENRIGFLVADVSGHGVPAALIAAMFKVAAHTVSSCADDPQQVLRRLNGMLSGQLRGQFITAAYLWLDMKDRKARYSAAGHPPLLRWRNGGMERIESNGLLFGVLPDTEYPVCEMELASGDRFLMYTDGVTEPENARGDAFGDRKLEQVVFENQLRKPAELSNNILAEISLWQPIALTQQDDITLIVVDVA